jgi:replication-associated recombination protein RarA
MEHLLWTEKYRPQTIEDCILPERLKKPFQEYVNQKQIPNLLLSGGAGVGKTTVARMVRKPRWPASFSKEFNRFCKVKKLSLMTR